MWVYGRTVGSVFLTHFIYIVKAIGWLSNGRNVGLAERRGRWNAPQLCGICNANTFLHRTKYLVEHILSGGVKSTAAFYYGKSCMGRQMYHTNTHAPLYGDTCIPTGKREEQGWGYAHLWFTTIYGFIEGMLIRIPIRFNSMDVFCWYWIDFVFLVLHIESEIWFSSVNLILQHIEWLAFQELVKWMQIFSHDDMCIASIVHIIICNWSFGLNCCAKCMSMQLILVVHWDI